jgi:hypothetical protein
MLTSLARKVCAGAYYYLELGTAQNIAGCCNCSIRIGRRQTAIASYRAPSAGRILGCSIGCCSGSSSCRSGSASASSILVPRCAPRVAISMIFGATVSVACSDLVLRLGRHSRKQPTCCVDKLGIEPSMLEKRNQWFDPGQTTLTSTTRPQDPLVADVRNFYKVEKWTRNGTKVDSLLYAGNILGRARSVFEQAIKHRPRIRLTIRQQTRVLDQWPPQGRTQ